MQISRKHVSFSETNFFSTLFLDYIKQNKKIKTFFSDSPDISSFKYVIEDFSKQKFNRMLLIDVLQQQNSRIKNEKLTATIDSLTDTKTFTVCTGHQLCLFTGPLYFIYKIITTINLAEELKKNYPRNNFVPVFWMASEDHDIDEINHINIFGKKVIWETEQKGAAGKFKTESLKSVVEELKMILGESENANQLLKLFSDAYLSNETLVDATRFLVNELFGEYGLVVLDGDDARLKKEFAPIIADDIFYQTNFKLVNDTIGQLEKIGYDAQVKPREINVFYLQEKSRKRIETAEEQYKSELKSNPERFSPNVVLRPLYQQMILPNIAYVGGPAEISYWLEFKKMFEHHKISFPVLIPRNSVLWIDEKSNEQMKKFEFDENKIFETVDSLSKKFVKSNSTTATSLSEEEIALKKTFEKIKSKAGKIDSTLKQSVEAELQRILNALKSIESKILRAEKQKHEASLNQIKKLKEKLFPNEQLQERYDNFIPYYLKHGNKFISILKKNLEAIPEEFIVLNEE